MAHRRGPVAVLRARRLGDRVTQSLFVVPAVMVLGAAALALVVDVVSRGVPAGHLPGNLAIAASSARTLLATVAGATITTVGVVFSVVVVSVQLASGQFSPRILRNFFHDWRAQLTVGVLAATFTYSVLALFSVDGRSGGSGNVPLVAVGIAVLLGLASIMSVVAFLDHSARRLYVGHLAERVMAETLALVDRLDGPDEHDRDDGPEPDAAPPADAVVVPARRDGWVQQMSVEAIAGALEAGTTVRLETRPGGYVTAGLPVARVWPAPRRDDAVDRVWAAFVVGSERTMQQDVDFGLRQLSDIALRALSPSVNDPHTAVEAVLRHGSVLGRLLRAGGPRRCVDLGGVRVLRPHEPDFADHVRHAFDDVRRAAAAQPAVLAAIIRTCAALAARAEAEGVGERGGEPLRQLALTLRGAERAGLLEADLDRLRELAATSVGWVPTGSPQSAERARSDRAASSPGSTGSQKVMRR